MIRESLFLRLFIAALLWIGMWVIAGNLIAFLICLIFFEQPLTDYMNIASHVGKLMPADILSANVAEDHLLELSKDLFNDSRAFQKQGVLKTIQGISSFIGFVGSSWLIVKIYKFKFTEFMNIKKSFSPKFFILVPLLFIAAVPFISYTGLINASMSLPTSLEGVEKWMREMEFQNGVLTMFLASGTSTGSLLSSILIMAVIPAIGEEFLFRGIMQRSLTDFNINPHTAILITGIVFSAIHMQFFGFFPRFFLGVILGYLYYWSGSIWVPIIGHFFQNASSVLLIYWMNNSNTPVADENMIMQPNVNMALFSVLLCAGLGFLIFKECEKQKAI